MKKYELDEVRALLDIMSDDDVVYLVKKPKTNVKSSKIIKSNKVLPFKGVFEFADEMLAENDVNQ